MKTLKLTNIEELRRRAEKYLTKHQARSDFKISESDNLKLIHELRVHEIEFTMQNDELKLSNAESELNVRKYSELYDFSPMGSFTLTNEGEIIELNIQGSRLLNKKQLDLICCQFATFIVDEDKPIFHLFLEKVFISNVEN